MKKSILFSLVLASFLFAQENETTIQSQTSTNEQSVFDSNNQAIINEEAKIIEPIAISSLEASQRMKINKEFFIIDIRAPQKIAIVGAINKTNLHIAYENFNQENYNFIENRYFYEELKYELASKNIPFEKDIYIFDNYGNSISNNVAKFLNELGYVNVYSIEDGFEGSKAKYGKFKNQRVVNGWKNKTNDWSLDFNSKKYWTNCKYSFLFEPQDRKICEPDFIEEINESQNVQNTLSKQIN